MTDSAVSVRFLRKGEDRLWRSCWYAATLDRKSEAAPFTDDPSFRPEAHLVAERSGRIVGKMEWIILEPHEAILVDPIVTPNESVEQIARTLLSEGLRVAQNLNVREIQVILQDRLPYLSTLLPMMEKWGFCPLWQKNLYSLQAQDLPAISDAPLWNDLEWVSLKGLDDTEFIGTLDTILSNAPLDRDGQSSDASTLLETCSDRCRDDGNYYPEDWEIGVLLRQEATSDVSRDRAPIGIVMPAFLEKDRSTAGNLYVGVVPGARGRGLGKSLHYRGLQTMANRGATKFLGSTDSPNLPMIKIFEGLNYQLEGIQHYFEPRTNQAS
jgi:ribosomal protein S18 acetylase RimI-like enzyme